MKIGLIGHGFVGTAVDINFTKRGHDMYIYDKFIKQYQNPNILCDTEICFICVPTPTDQTGYDLSALDDVFALLDRINYKGIIVNKCTVLPGTTAIYSRKYTK